MTPRRPGVLLIELEHPEAALVRASLDRPEYRVASLPASLVDLAALRAARPDVALISTGRADDAGAVLLDRIKTDADLHDLAVIMLPHGADGTAVARCVAMGADDVVEGPIEPTVLRARVRGCLERRRFRRQRGRYQQELEDERQRFDDLARAVIPIGVSLMAERDFDRLLETILEEAQRLCHADGGTLYLRTDDERLRFVIVRNTSLGIRLGGRSGGPVAFDPLPLHDGSGAPNHRNVATHVALTGRSSNIPDVDAATDFEFSGTKAFDARTGYHSQSFLTIPLRDGPRVIGVLQLLNALDRDGAVMPFPPSVEPVVESLSLLAAAALRSYEREQRLHAQIRELQIQIDGTRRERQVAEIADTDYFQELQRRARKLREER